MSLQLMRETRGKSKRSMLNVRQKLAIVDKLEATGVSRTDIMEEFNIPRSTLSTLIKEADSLRKKVAKNPRLLENQRIKKPKYAR